ncbi:hypothetical protein F4778DRAFT_216231 [Xylariomycetidae sp. FL2044]|nr:hypothetical protein F4778DRAFT_216231 [Xylariomycetidae sp. FL2044]
MLPTPDTSHVPYDRIYEPAEDSFLLLDTLSSATETAFLQRRFFSYGHQPNNNSTTTTTTTTNAASSSPPPPPHPQPPLILEVGPGSGVVIAFVSVQARHIFGPQARVLTCAVDVNAHACRATGETVRRAVVAAAEEKENERVNEKEKEKGPGGRDDDDGSGGDSDSGVGGATFLGAWQGDLVGPLRPGVVDVLVFNPPYVPTAELPRPWQGQWQDDDDDDATNSNNKTNNETATTSPPSFDEDSYLLSLSYAGGRDGMEVTERLIEGLPRTLSDRGCAYILLCAQNRPDEVKARIRAGWLGSAAGNGGGSGGGDGGWRVETVGSSGKKAGWERLQVIRIWREG